MCSIFLNGERDSRANGIKTETENSDLKTRKYYLRTERRSEFENNFVDLSCKKLLLTYFLRLLLTFECF